MRPLSKAQADYLSRVQNAGTGVAPGVRNDFRTCLFCARNKLTRGEFCPRCGDVTLALTAKGNAALARYQGENLDHFAHVRKMVMR